MKTTYLVMKNTYDRTAVFPRVPIKNNIDHGMTSAARSNPCIGTGGYASGSGSGTAGRIVLKLEE